MTTTERRRFSRIDFDAQVELSQGSQTCTAELVDISIKGLLLEQTNGVKLLQGEPVYVKILLSDQTAIAMSAEIAHQSGTQLGLECALIDIDSMSHLRRLIELNLGDPSAAERELIELIRASAR
jgi:hypothetical protein